jgi:hypothetical protein
MTDSQSLDLAYALREKGNFREAYGLFMLAANRTENLLERAGILLNAATNLTQSDEQERSRNQLKQIRELLGSMNPSAFTSDEQDEFIRVTVSIEIEVRLCDSTHRRGGLVGPPASRSRWATTFCQRVRIF